MIGQENLSISQLKMASLLSQLKSNQCHASAEVLHALKQLGYIEEADRDGYINMMALRSTHRLTPKALALVASLRKA